MQCLLLMAKYAMKAKGKQKKINNHNMNMVFFRLLMVDRNTKIWK